MKVGALEETVTVSGASPVVDVQNTCGSRPDNSIGVVVSSTSAVVVAPSS